MTTRIHHLQCGSMHAPPYTPAICHCLLLEDRLGLALVDTGLGLLDVQQPVQRLGQPIIDIVGFQFNEAETAIRQVENLGYQASDVRHIVLTHADPDHTGGLADFPNATVHLSSEELLSVTKGHWRYVSTHFTHDPKWKPCPASDNRWYGLQARPIDLGFASDVLLIPLFGHTDGHCGVAIANGDRWLLHVGDAYYLRAELTQDDHPVSQLAAQRAESDAERQRSLAELRRLANDHRDEINLFGYHDPEELP